MDAYVIYTSDDASEGYSSPLYAAETQEAAIRRVEREVAVYEEAASSFSWTGDSDLLWYASPESWVTWWVKRLLVEVV